MEKQELKKRFMEIAEEGLEKNGLTLSDYQALKVVVSNLLRTGEAEFIQTSIAEWLTRNGVEVSQPIYSVMYKVRMQ